MYCLSSGCMTKIFPVQTARLDSFLARPRRSIRTSPGHRAPARAPRKLRGLGRAAPPVPGCPGSAPRAPATGGTPSRAPRPRPAPPEEAALPARRGLRAAASPGLMAVREVRVCARQRRETPIQRGSQSPAAKAQLILSGTTPRTGRAGRPADILPGQPSPPSPLPARWFPGRREKERGVCVCASGRGESGGREALIKQQQDKENHVRRQRRARGSGSAAATPGPGRCGPSCQRASLRGLQLQPAARPFLRAAF